MIVLDIYNLRLADFVYDFNKMRQRFSDVILQEGDGPTVIPTLAKKNHVWARWGNAQDIFTAGDFRSPFASHIKALSLSLRVRS